MYVCLCHGVTDTHIKEAVAQGHQRMRDLRRELGVTRQCGKCASHALAVLNGATAKTSSSARQEVSPKDWSLPMWYSPQPV